MKIVSYSRQCIDENDIAAVIKVLHSEFLTQGPQVGRFEKRIASYCGVKFAVAFSSGTAALHGACFAAGISKGDEVITTPMTFAASANCVLYCGGKPVFADIKTDIPLIDPEEIKKKISKRTKAIIPVDYAGIPADYDEINAIAKANNLIIIADAAHSLGATYKGKKVGQLADMTVFSFHAIKAITTGEGGMVVTNNKNFYEKLKIFRTHGITKEKKFFKNQSHGNWYYEMKDLGYNYRLTDIQAALGISQLKKLDSFIKKRREIAKIYIQAFRELPFIDTLLEAPKVKAAWHLFPIIIDKKVLGKKKKIFAALHKHGIKAQVHYIPIHLHPYYVERFGFQPGDFPNSEDFYQREISIPIYPSLNNKVIRKVIDIISKEIS